MNNILQLQPMSTEMMEQMHKNMEGSVCWLMDESLVLPMFYANMAIAIAYFIIPACIFSMLIFLRRLITTKHKVFLWGMVFFIASCGIGHFIKMKNFWWGNFKLELLVDQITAVISIAMAVFSMYGAYRLTYAYFKSPNSFLANMTNILALAGALKLIEGSQPKKKGKIFAKLEKQLEREMELITIEDVFKSFPLGEKEVFDDGRTLESIEVGYDDDNGAQKYVVLAGFVPKGVVYLNHFHDGGELITGVKGTAKERISGKILKSTDSLYFGPREAHGYEAKTPWHFTAKLYKI